MSPIHFGVRLTWIRREEPYPLCHVLIIEDEPLVAMDLEALLSLEGATSFAFAACQEDAVAEAVSRAPSIIISDVKLLEGTGPMAVAIILDRLGPIPVIFITGTPEACRPCNPASSVFPKPFDRPVIAQAFREMVAAI